MFLRMRRPAASDSYHDSDDVVEPALGWLGSGHGVAFATVLRTWGSAPRPVGSQLAVDDRGVFVGSVSGGCVEAATVAAALEVLAGSAPKRLEFGVADADAWNVGLACGGHIEVFVHDVRSDRALLEALLADRRARRTAVVAIDLGSGRSQLVHAFDDDALRQAVARDASALDGDRFLRVHAPRPRLVVVGAVHIAVPLVQMAKIHGFDVTIVDPRSAFLDAERFAGIDVELRGQWPDAALGEIGIDARTAVVVLSHDPKIDDPALAAALASGAFYLGALGSRRTHSARAARLTERGLPADSVARIRGPVGLDIGARSAAEIATSILAEIIQTLRRGAP